MGFSADSIRDIIGTFVENRKTDATQNGIVLPEDLQDASDAVITTHHEEGSTCSSVLNDLRVGFRNNLLCAIDAGIHEKLRRLRSLEEKRKETYH